MEAKKTLSLEIVQGHN
jgi:hypothetical protein